MQHTHRGLYVNNETVKWILGKASSHVCKFIIIFFLKVTSQIGVDGQKERLF